MSSETQQEAITEELKSLALALAWARDRERELVDDLNRSGFERDSDGIAKALFDSFVESVGRTNGSSQADWPWSKMRELAIDLNSRGQRSAAMGALEIVNGLLLVEKRLVPTNGIMKELESDRQRIEKSIADFPSEIIVPKTNKPESKLVRWVVVLLALAAVNAVISLRHNERFRDFLESIYRSVPSSQNRSANRNTHTDPYDQNRADDTQLDRLKQDLEKVLEPDKAFNAPKKFNYNLWR